MIARKLMIKQRLFCKFSVHRFLRFSFGKRGISFFQFPHFVAEFYENGGDEPQE